MSFSELGVAALAIASTLRLQGVGAGDRVAIMVPNGLDFPLAWLAIPMLRAVAVPVNVTYGDRDLAHVLSHSGASTVLAGREQLARVEAARASAPGLRRVLELLDGRVVAGTEASDGELAESSEERGADAQDAVTLQYTSGTTEIGRASCRERV